MSYGIFDPWKIITSHWQTLSHNVVLSFAYDWAKMNERLPNMTPNGMLLDVSVWMKGYLTWPQMECY